MKKKTVSWSDVLPSYSSKALLLHVEAFLRVFIRAPSPSRASCDVLSCGHSSAYTVTLCVCLCVYVCVRMPTSVIQS